jgi:LCP family protein required for cell wall assembly
MGDDDQGDLTEPAAPHEDSALLPALSARAGGAGTDRSFAAPAGWGALAAGILVPGLGHLWARHSWWKAVFFVGAGCLPPAALASSLLRAVDDYERLLSLVEAPQQPLSIVLLALSAMLLIHVWSLVDLCHLSVQWPLSGIRRVVLAAAVTAALYALPAAFAVYLTYELQQSAAALTELDVPMPGGTPHEEPPVQATPVPVTAAAPVTSPSQAAPVVWPAWSGTERVTILLLGLDTRPDERQRGIVGNTDAILLLCLDPVARRALLVSLPRDLWVTMPGRGQGKINAAYGTGGPELLKRTVAALTGLPVHYYAAVRFDGFTRIIDAFGGVVLDVARPVKDNQYPTDDYRLERIFIPAGVQWMSGATALQYVRSRHESSDFERSRRQQNVLLALRSRLGEPDTALRLLEMAPDLAALVETDLGLREAILLAGLARQIEIDDVVTLVLAPPEFGREINSPSLYSIVPDQAAIQQRLAELLATKAG